MTTIYIDEPEEFYEIEWPDGWRIPAPGELILLGLKELTVAGVQWELDQGSQPAVQLRVTLA